MMDGPISPFAKRNCRAQEKMIERNRNEREERQNDFAWGKKYTRTILQEKNTQAILQGQEIHPSVFAGSEKNNPRENKTKVKKVLKFSIFPVLKT